MASSPAPRTIFLAKLIGPTALLVGLSMLLKKSTALDIIAAFMHDAPLLFVTAMISVAVGLAIVLGHNVWRRGALTTVVTLVGWLVLIKGVVLLFLSPEQSANFLMAVHYRDLFYLYTALPVLLGLYLTWAGFELPPGR